MFLQLINKDIAFFDEIKTGEILSRLTADTEIIQDGLSTNISMFFRSFLTCLAVIGVCCFLSVELTLITVGSIAPIIFVAIFYAKAIRKLSK